MLVGCWLCSFRTTTEETQSKRFLGCLKWPQALVTGLSLLPPKQRVNEFLQSLHQCLTPGATVLFMDNTPAQCDRLPLSHTDEVGNTTPIKSRDLESQFKIYHRRGGPCARPCSSLLAPYAMVTQFDRCRTFLQSSN